MDPMAWDGKEIASMDSDTLAKALKIALDRCKVLRAERDEAYRREAVAQAERETLRYALDRATAMLTRTAETDRGGPHGENATRALKEIARILS